MCKTFTTRNTPVLHNGLKLKEQEPQTKPQHLERQRSAKQVHFRPFVELYQVYYYPNPDEIFYSVSL
jgi:hypothetical protein